MVSGPAMPMRLKQSNDGHIRRFVHAKFHHQVLVYADGLCKYNGQPDASGTSIVYYRPYNRTHVIQEEVPSMNEYNFNLDHVSVGELVRSVPSSIFSTA